LIKTQHSDNGRLIVINTAAQNRIDSLKQLALVKDTLRIYPFNPNFVTDYKGYTLGMSTEEIDRLLKYREAGKYVNSISEFQKVTQIPDSLLNVISPYFKFPTWTQKEKTSNTDVKNVNSLKESSRSQIIDLNKATAEELKRISGIGEKLSNRIVKFRNRLGGFLVNEQLYDVYGLNVQVADKALEQFQVLELPNVKKIKINLASVDELSSLIYISKQLAHKIITYRTQNGPFRSMEDLEFVPDFPIEKIDRIGLYLSFAND